MDRQRMGGVASRKLVAEFIGTFTMVFAGCGAVAADELIRGGVTHLGICLTFGLAVCVMIYATGHISGAHFNPAVTVGFAAAKRFPWREVPAYIIAQCLAATCAIFMLRMMVGVVQLGETLPAIDPGPAFVAEFMLTFILMFVISAVATDHRAVGQLAGVAIGGTVTVCALFGGPLTGASMNPARSLGPALFGSGRDWMWLYALAPIAGAVTASLTYGWMRCSDEPGQNVSGCC